MIKLQLWYLIFQTTPSLQCGRSLRVSLMVNLGFSLHGMGNVKYRWCEFVHVELMVSFLGSKHTRFGVKINFLHQKAETLTRSAASMLTVCRRSRTLSIRPCRHASHSSTSCIGGGDGEIMHQVFLYQKNCSVIHLVIFHTQWYFISMLG